jgi:Tol biopolymer transport system component
MNPVLRPGTIAGLALLAPVAWPQATRLVSADSAGVQGSGFSSLGFASADGRFVVFVSGATNLIPGGDANGTSIDVFVRDLDSGSLELVSRNTNGVQANGSSGGASISGDARFVAFSSLATNLSAGADANGAISDVFLRDRVLNTTERVSTTWNGVQPLRGCGYPSISADGRFVAFVSDDFSLVPNPNPYAVFDVFVRDRLAATTVLASVGATGAHADADCASYALSGDGRFVAFVSESTTLTPGPDGNGVLPDVFVRDLAAGLTEVVSVGPGGAQVAGSSFSPGISHDGRFVAFSCSSDAVVAGDANGWPDVFVRDRATGTTRLASLGQGGVQADRPCELASISGDGRCVSFVSLATNLLSTAVPFTFHVYVRDLLTGSIELASQSTGGVPANGPAESCSLSSDGSTCVFTSFATNLVVPDANGAKDVFARQRGDGARSYCFGDGTGAACPCGNAGTARRGCENSATTGGAALSAIGDASLSADTLRLEGSGFPATATALFFQGTLAAQGGAGFAFGDGLRCTTGPIVRLGVRTASGGIAAYGAGVGSDVPVSVRGAVAGAFSSRSYQVWYRDAAPFCTVSTFNLTNGARCTWTP